MSRTVTFRCDHGDRSLKFLYLTATAMHLLFVAQILNFHYWDLINLLHPIVKLCRVSLAAHQEFAVRRVGYGEYEL
ncbi:MAG: hypothetical protein HC773_23585 [Scytonema sp. CRU_2_7]|nr:hypothetical protein [Scytonema sp. CRU_2_7]